MYFKLHILQNCLLNELSNWKHGCLFNLCIRECKVSELGNASRPCVQRVYKYGIHKLGTEHNPKSLFFLNNVSSVVLLSSLDHKIHFNALCIQSNWRFLFPSVYPCFTLCGKTTTTSDATRSFWPRQNGRQFLHEMVIFKLAKQHLWWPRPVTRGGGCTGCVRTPPPPPTGPKGPHFDTQYPS